VATLAILVMVGGLLVCVLFNYRIVLMFVLARCVMVYHVIRVKGYAKCARRCVMDFAIPPCQQSKAGRD